MTTYLVVIAILCILSLLEGSGANKETSLLGKLSCAVLILFGGLRFETGFDWMAYEDYYDLTQPIWSNVPQHIEQSLLVEPGFAIINLVAKSIYIPFQAFLFIITFVNMITIYFFSRRYTKNIALVFLVYYGFIFLAGQMAAIRQTLSYSFLLMALMSKSDGHPYKSILLSLLAVGTHTFTLIFVPLIYVRIPKFPIYSVVIVVAVGVGAAFSGFQVIQVASDTLLPLLGGGFLATKLSLYGDYEGYAVSLVSLLFVPVHLASYYLLTTNRFKNVVEEKEITTLAATITLFSLMAHSYFGLFPAVWNRVSYLSFVVQIIALTSMYRFYFQRAWTPVIVSSMAGAMGAGIIAYTLSSPTSLPFVPYQNIAIAWITGDYGDGRWRYAYAFQQAEQEIASKRR